MRIAPGELQAIRGQGMLTRYALLGPAAFVIVEFGADGTVGTGLDQPCLTDHHAIVARGQFAVHHADGRSETFQVGDAFYVPHGPPTHTFSSSPDAVVSGFAPTPTPPDTTDAALEARGFSVVEGPAVPLPPPTSVTLAGSVQPFRRTGAVDVEGSRMGDWLFMRSRLGPRSGYASGPCELSHWGLVLDGEILIASDGATELATRGDVYFAAGGHRITSPDGAAIVDYTPIADLAGRRAETWRRAAITRFQDAVADPPGGSSGVASGTATRAAMPPVARRVAPARG